MNIDKLIASGFFAAGRWIRDAGGNNVYEGDFSAENGIYIFAMQRHIQYVGSALGSGGLRRRMKSYQRRQQTLSSSRPVHIKLAKAISGGHEVAIYTCLITERGSWNGLPINLVLGVEAGLIGDINPPWNRRGRTLVLDNDTIGNDADDAT